MKKLGHDPLKEISPEVLSKVMAKLGRKGGQSTSEKKKAAARLNGKNGGKGRKKDANR